MDTIGAVWREAQARLNAAHEVAPREAREMVQTLLELDDTALLLLENAPFPDDKRPALEAMVLRRTGGEPLGYILGFAWFYGRKWQVTPDTLIPRPDTEVLVEAVLGRIEPDFRVLEIGLGSGCIMGTLLAERADFLMRGVDISAAACAVALENIRHYSAPERSDITCGAGFEGIDERFNLIVSNPPYIPDAEWENLESEVKNFEPRLALTGGEPNADGLNFYRMLVTESPKHLHPRGWLCMEVGWQQAEAVTNLLQQEGKLWDDISVSKDLAGRDRVVCARLR